MGLDTMILVLWMLSFKPAFLLSSFLSVLFFWKESAYLLLLLLVLIPLKFVLLSNFLQELDRDNPN